MTQLKMLTAEDKLAEIRRLYFKASRQSIQQDLAKALDLLKSMATEEERERATVYMEGLAEMQRDWLKAAGKAGRPGGGAKPGKTGGPGRGGKVGGAAATGGSRTEKTGAPGRSGRQQKPGTPGTSVGTGRAKPR